MAMAVMSLRPIRVNSLMHFDGAFTEAQTLDDGWICLGFKNSATKESIKLKFTPAEAAELMAEVTLLLMKEEVERKRDKRRKQWEDE